jgi:hypothetical protein
MGLGSEIQDPEKTYSGSGSRGQKGSVSHALSLPPPGTLKNLKTSRDSNFYA